MASSWSLTASSSTALAAASAAWRFSMASSSPMHAHGGGAEDPEDPEPPWSIVAAPDLGASDVDGEVVAPTHSSTQTAASHLNRRVPFTLVSPVFFWCERLSCPNEPTVLVIWWSIVW